MIASSKFYRPSGWGLHKTTEGELVEVEGHVSTKHGFVLAYSQTWRTEKISIFSMILSGREYRYRAVGRAYTQRAIVTASARFADECAALAEVKS